MLSLKNISKTYHPKRGVPVKALVDVSVDFQEKGLVFILGKSGSGKSTMLNIIGGLDKADQGEVIIKGKSSRQFKGSDFDNYRNTFVGFVFQEYNLLSDFNIGKNIALALELQGKSTNKESVDEILTKVDLKGYENRKVNELSGGQKQRVAIARALIKNPEIILADEPTGALDSVTGHQVFDILRKLGKEKLVIVVSHDRDTAEEYADRIIETKDGQIISDTFKTALPSTEVMPGVIVNKNVIHFTEDHKFTLKDIDLLQTLQNDNPSVVITKDINLLSAFSFNETNQDNLNLQQYDGSKLKLISSKLKNIDSFKIGASGLKYKKVRLFFTILLSFVAVSFFALTDTLSAFNSEEAHAHTLQANHVNTVSVTQYYESDEYSYRLNDSIGFSDEQIADMKGDFPNASIIPSVSENLYYNFDFETISLLSESDRILYTFYSSFASDSSRLFIDENFLEERSLTLLAGQFPTSDGQFLITSFELELFKRFSFPYFTFDELETPTAAFVKPNQFSTNEVSNANLIINKSVDIGDKNRVISGVIDVEYDSSYLSEDYLKEAAEDYVIRNEFANYVSYNGLSSHYLREEALDGMKNSKEGFADEIYSANASVTLFEQATSPLSYFIKEDDLYADQLIKINNQPLANDEIIVSIDVLAEIASYQEFINLEINMDTYELELVITFSEAEKITYANINDFLVWDQIPANHQKLCDLLASRDEIEIWNYNIEGKKSKYKLAGIYLATDQITINELDETIYKFTRGSSTITLNDFNGQNFSLSIVNTLIFNVHEGANLYDQFMKLYHYKGRFSLWVHSPYSSTFEMFGSLVVGLRVTFLILGSVLAVFSALLMMNFIATSISYKRHDIGILRGLGARRIDVVKIFTFESLIIAAVNIILAVAATIPVIYLINGQIADALDMNIVVLSFTLRQFALTVLIAVGSALIASVLPVLNIARKKPIDAINNK
ncbi:MAG TPA: ATP-binding cassette domain-containing protein [Bacilli bacterium]|nr:ATP-binding cassette domain-containing protein [Bacilli bacterium]